jgi:hypothetical protein
MGFQYVSGIPTSGMSNPIGEILSKYRSRTRGPFADPITTPFSRIIVGDGQRLTYDYMASFGISHVLNCADESACRIELPPDRYTCINAIDSSDVHIYDRWYAEFKETMDKYLRNPECKNVYVHCQAGMNRSAALAAGYIVRKFGVPVEKVVQTMASQRPCVLTNEAFQKQLFDFAKKSA